MIKYLSLLLQCTSVVLLGVATCYLYFQAKTLLKMVEVSINDLVLGVPYDPPKTDTKLQKLIKCSLARNSKQYLGKAYTKERINELSAEEVDILFGNYEEKLSGQMMKCLDKLIIRMYSLGACVALGMRNQLQTVLHIQFVPHTPKH